MHANILALIAIAAYLGSSFLIFRQLCQNPEYISRIPLLLAWLGALSHLSFIVAIIHQRVGFSFSIFSMASLVALIVVLLLLAASINKPVEKLGIALFPIAALMLGADIMFSESPQSLQNYNWKMGTHIVTSIIAFSLLNIAALQSILLAIQDQQLKSHPPKRFIQSLPSLQTMESLLFQMLSAGVFFLTISLASGFIFIEDLFAQHLVHKTVLSIVAWIIFSALLLGRSRFGWRGSTAIKWTLSGFASLLLAYFGSKMVLEIILHR